MIITKLNKNIKSFINKSSNSIKKIYNDVVLSIDFSSVICPYCGKCHWAFHAAYERNLIIDYRIITFDIQRVICKECGHTHAILLDCMIPYAIYDADHILSVDHDYHHNKAKLFDNISYYLLCILFKRAFPCLFINPHNFSLPSTYNKLVFQTEGGLYYVFEHLFCLQ